MHVCIIVIYFPQTKDGCYVSNVRDKILIPGKYVTAEEHHQKILAKVSANEQRTCALVHISTMIQRFLHPKERCVGYYVRIIAHII